MNSLKLVWIKELKNCVPFYVFADGKECGVLKQGEMLEVALRRQSAELYFVPKAPSFFGWKALKLKVKLHGDAPEIHLGVMTPVIVESQLHCIQLNGAEVITAEYIKKYNKLLTDLRNMQFVEEEEISPELPEPRYKLGEGFYFEFDEVSNWIGGYRKINVYLLKIDDPSFKRCIVDENGMIENFPGIEKGDWIKELEYPLGRKTQFRFWINEFKDGKALVEWTLQPEGRYFEDEDGFGGESCMEITLHSYIDTNGIFTEPFKYR